MTRPRQLVDDSEDDRGAALILVLFVVMVIGLAGAALLTFSDTSIRTTVALRDQAAAAYAADGAGQVAVNQLRTNTLPCATHASGLALPNFYPGSNGAAPSSAYVWCTPDGANATGGYSTAANASTGNAILTLGTGVAGEDGLYISSNAGPVDVRGGVYSNSTINANSGGLNNTSSLPYNLAEGDCTNPNLITPPGNTTCNYAAANQRGTDPGTVTPHGTSYNTPAKPTGAGTIGTCPAGTTFQTVNPGRFTDANALNALTGCTTKIVNFLPGTYYFDFAAGQPVWTINNIYAIAGTATIPLTTTPTVAQMPTACVLPQDPAATTTSGVEFVFGGVSRVEVKHTGSPGGQLTVCASKAASGPPMAVFGLKTALAGSFPVTVQSGCITDPSTRCPLIYTDNSPNTTLTVQGTVYAPQAWLNLTLSNSSSTSQQFEWGLISRALTINASAGADLTTDVVDIPDVAATPAAVPNVLYLSVYVCPDSASCDATGTVRLRAKVLLSTTTPTAVTVLSWSVQR